MRARAGFGIYCAVNKAHKEAGLDPVQWVKAAVDAAGGGKCGGGGNNGNGTVPRWGCDRTRLAFVRVRVRVRVRVHACVCACVRVCVRSSAPRVDPSATA